MSQTRNKNEDEHRNSEFNIPSLINVLYTSQGFQIYIYVYIYI